MRDFDLLETLRWDPHGGYALLERHLARAHASARHFGFAYDPAAASHALARAIAGRTTPARVRLLIGRGGVARCEATDLIERSTPWRVALAATPIPAADDFLYHKTTQRAVYEAARRARPDADAVLLWNEGGEITEGTEANVVAELDGRRVTPPVECGLLPGTMRAELLEHGDLVEQRIPIEELRRAARVWLINSVRGWMDVVLVD